MKQRSKFKRRETVEKISSNTKEKYGRLARSMGVVVEKNRPVFESAGGHDECGPIQIDVVVCRGNSKLSFTAEEAECLVGLLQESLPLAQSAETTCREERLAWKSKQRKRASDEQEKTA